MSLFNVWFNVFLCSCCVGNLFCCCVMFEVGFGLGNVEVVLFVFIIGLVIFVQQDEIQLLVMLGLYVDGFSLYEVGEWLVMFGFNEVDYEKLLLWWWYLWQCYCNLFNLLLIILVVVFWLIEDIKVMIVIGVMVLLFMLICFVQEGCLNWVVEWLKVLVGNIVCVLCCNFGIEVVDVVDQYFGVYLYSCCLVCLLDLLICELVFGDYIVLLVGDMILVDCCVLIVKDLFVVQVVMIGELLLVEKFVYLGDGLVGLLEQYNLLFMGINVVFGIVIVIVLVIGNCIYFGMLVQCSIVIDCVLIVFQVGVNSVSWLLICFVLVMVLFVLLINGWIKGDWIEVFLFVLLVVVGLMLEMLLMIVIFILVKGVVLLLWCKVIVKCLDVIQNFGVMEVLCIDKIGMFIQDRIVLECYIDVFGYDLEDVLKFVYFNSYFQIGLINLLDCVVLEYVELQSLLWLLQDYYKVDEILFDFECCCMLVVVFECEDYYELICKGVVEEMLVVCSIVCENGQDMLLDEYCLVCVWQIIEELNEQGLCVVVVVMKEIVVSQIIYLQVDECGLILVGYVVFLDLLKELVVQVLQVLVVYGVEVKVFIGDNELVIVCVCVQVGLDVDIILIGLQIECMDDGVLVWVLYYYCVFVWLILLYKECLVCELCVQGKVVGFLGDGINDVLVLCVVDIGISVDSVVDIVKEVVDIILLEKNLMVLEEGVIQGWCMFNNMLKYICMIVSFNFGNVFLVLVVLVFLLFLFMLLLQLLVQNLLYDILQIVILFDNVDEELV